MLAGLTMCNGIAGQDDDSWRELTGDKLVTFASGVTTKTTSPLPNNTSFGVFAFLQNGVIGSSSGLWADLATKHWAPNFMFNEEVLFDGSDYIYAPHRYWPSNSENKLTFWAYCPYEASPDLLVAGSTSTSYTGSSEGIPDIRFTVDGHTDVLYSDVVADQTYASNSGIVPFSFAHALALIDVQAEKVDSPGTYTVTLKSVSFKGLYMTAIFRNSTWTWANYSGNRQNILVWEDDPDDDGDNKVLAHNSPISVGSALPLPQVLTNDASRMHVEFDVSYLKDPLDPSTRQSYSTSRDVYLKDVFYDAGQEWAKDCHYTLTIRITPDKPIQFTVSWSDWGAEHNYQLSS